MTKRSSPSFKISFNKPSTSLLEEYLEALTFSKEKTVKIPKSQIVKYGLSTENVLNVWEHVDSDYIKEDFSKSWIQYYQSNNLDSKRGTGIAQVATNKCYMNAALQLIFRLCGVLKLLKSNIWYSKLFEKKNVNVYTFTQELLYVILKSGYDYYSCNSYFAPFALYNKLKKHSKYEFVKSRNQQDVHEFLVYLTDDMREGGRLNNSQIYLHSFEDRNNYHGISVKDNINEYSKWLIQYAKDQNYNVFGNTIDGGHIVLDKCSSCGWKNFGLVYPLLIHSLNLKQKVNKKKNDIFEDNELDTAFPSGISSNTNLYEGRVEELINIFCRWELINNHKCPRCKSGLQHAIRIIQDIDSLVLHIKRFKYNFNKNKYRKLKTRIKLSDYLSWNGNRNYRLLAVVVHNGNTPNVGHYFTYVYRRGWIKFDDKDKDILGEKSLEDLEDYDLMCKNAYILLYEKNLEI